MSTSSSHRPRSTAHELLLDVALPLGLYFLLHAGLGVALVTSLVVSSIPPAVRQELRDLKRDRGQHPRLGRRRAAAHVRGLKLFRAKDDPDRNAAWERLSSACAEFHRLQARYSAVWGVVLLAECAARIVGAFTLPVSTMAWASDAMIALAIATAAIVSGALCVNRMQALIEGEVDPGCAPPRRHSRPRPEGVAA
jgi:hypothetical protein